MDKFPAISLSKNYSNRLKGPRRPVFREIGNHTEIEMAHHRADEGVYPYVDRKCCPRHMRDLSVIVQSSKSQEACTSSQLFFNPQQLVVLRDAISA